MRNALARSGRDLSSETWFMLVTFRGTGLFVVNAKVAAVASSDSQIILGGQALHADPPNRRLGELRQRVARQGVPTRGAVDPVATQED